MITKLKTFEILAIEQQIKLSDFKALHDRVYSLMQCCKSGYSDCQVRLPDSVSKYSITGFGYVSYPFITMSPDRITKQLETLKEVRDKYSTTPEWKKSLQPNGFDNKILNQIDQEFNNSMLMLTSAWCNSTEYAYKVDITLEQLINCEISKIEKELEYIKEFKSKSPDELEKEFYPTEEATNRLAELVKPFNDSTLDNQEFKKFLDSTVATDPELRLVYLDFLYNVFFPAYVSINFVDPVSLPLKKYIEIYLSTRRR